MASQPRTEPRRLPVRPGPMHNETVFSYVGRLADANHLSWARMRAFLAKPSDADPRAPIVPDRIAAATGYSLLGLAQALPELRWQTVDRWRFHPRPLPACPGCYQGLPVVRFLDSDILICCRHQRWIGPPDNRPGRQHIDLSALPDVIAAQARHRNLRRRHGYITMGLAWGDALRIHLRWAQRGEHGQHSRRRLDALAHDPRHKIQLGDDAFHASIYPETVALASLLASAHWQHTAQAYAKERMMTFFAEAARRIGSPNYTPYYASDPLGLWVDTIRTGGARQRAARAALHGDTKR